MKLILAFVAGIMVTNVLHPSTTLYGGAFTSSPIASVYGYADDNAGCRQISACLNYAQHNRMLTGKFDVDWSRNGNHYCE